MPKGTWPEAQQHSGTSEEAGIFLSESRHWIQIWHEATKLQVDLDGDVWWCLCMWPTVSLRLRFVELIIIVLKPCVIMKEVIRQQYASVIRKFIRNYVLLQNCCNIAKLIVVRCTATGKEGSNQEKILSSVQKRLVSYHNAHKANSLGII